MASTPAPQSPPHQILVPLDGSRLAEAVLPVAAAIARATGGGLTLLHVIEHDAPATVHGQPHLGDTPSAQHYLDGIAERFRPGIVVTTHAHPNPEHDVARSIAEHARELGAALIVLATHGSGGVGRLLFGRIAQHVVQDGEVAVLVIRPEKVDPRAAFRCRSILVASDGGAESDRTLDDAAALARALGARLHVVRVVETLGSVRRTQAVATTLMPTATAAMLELESEQARDYLRAIRRRLDVPAGIDVELRRGDVVDELVAAARERPVDIIALATHAKAGIEGLLTGSIAARLLGRVDLPVLLIRRGDAPR